MTGLRGAALLLALGGCASPVGPSAPIAAPAGESRSAPEARPAEGTQALVEDAPGPTPSTETVTLKLVADARRQARVFWGRKDLGLAPLEVTRPRGSGPLDLLVVAPGALPLHTRAFTDRSETLALRLYSEKEAAGLLGWKASDSGPAKGPAKGPEKGPSKGPEKGPDPPASKSQRRGPF